MTICVVIHWYTMIVGLLAGVSAYCTLLVAYSYFDHPKVRRILWGIGE